MLEYESRVALYRVLAIPDLPLAHWCDSLGWTLASYMYREVVEEAERLNSAARYIAVTIDEATSVDNNSFFSVHTYIV